MRAFWIGFVFLLTATISVQAEMITEKRNGAIWVKSATTAETEELFKKHDYIDFDVIHARIPRIFFTTLPTDWQDVPNSDNKNRTFIRIILPLVLKVNEQILAERSEIEEIWAKFNSQAELSDKELSLIEEKAHKYDIFTRLQGKTRTAFLLKQLLTNIDALPPSLMVAAAGIYSDWGNSRLARQANSLYLEEIWYEKQGLRPADDENADYRYKMYGNLEECIASRSLRLNSHLTYMYLRVIRKMYREINRPFYGPHAVTSLIKDNNLKNIAGMIDYTLSYYRLQKTDYEPTLEDVK